MKFGVGVGDGDGLTLKELEDVRKLRDVKRRHRGSVPRIRWRGWWGMQPCQARLQELQRG